MNRLALCLLAVCTAACEREARTFSSPPGSRVATAAASMTELHAGPTPAPAPVSKNPYDENAYAISQGKRYYVWFNCNGCHADGGGDSGPPLMDDQWIYGHEPASIFATIVEGRPNGMPSFRGRIPDNQIWQIVAYVRSLSGLVPQDARAGRSDHLQAKEPEQMKEPERPTRGGLPPASTGAQ